MRKHSNGLPSDVRKGFALPFAEPTALGYALPGRSPLKLDEKAAGRAKPYRTSDGIAVSTIPGYFPKIFPTFEARSEAMSPASPAAAAP